MITSKQNALIKELRSLSDKKNRDNLNRYIVEGVKNTLEAINSGFKIFVVIGTEKGLNALGDIDVRIETVSDDVFKSVSSEVSPQGVIAVVEKPENSLLPVHEKSLLLDGVADPSNVGAIVRTAAAAGYDRILMTEECADPFSPKAVRSSMGGVFRVQFTRAPIDKLLDSIKVPLVVADMHGENVFNKHIVGEFCLVIGNEGQGVSERAKSHASTTVSIPMENGMESLNAAVSAGILMYNLK